MVDVFVGRRFTDDTCDEVEVSHRFDAEELREEFGSKRTDEELQQIADILAANVECPELDEDDLGCMVICRSNFNDSFEDMMDDIRNMF